MNKVYLSGEVFDAPKLVNRPEAEPHLVFTLLVSHHSKQGVRKELYRISAWNNCAVFCSLNLKTGMRIALQGYLTQRPILLGERLFKATEVTISEVFAPNLRIGEDAAGMKINEEEGSETWKTG